MKTMRLGLVLLTLSLILTRPVFSEQTDETIKHAETQPISFICNATVSNDALIQAYIDSLSACSSNSSLTAIPRYSGSRLSARDGQVYNLLLPHIYDVANGLRASTEFTLTLGDLGFPSFLTAADLFYNSMTFDGVTLPPITVDGQLSDVAAAAASSYVSFDLESIVTALLYDCPYAMYWCDKTQLFNLSAVPFDYDEHGIYFNSEDTITFSFPVIPEYATDTYTFNTTVSATVQAAVAKASEIVSQYAALSDYEKLKAYSSTICSLTSYNVKAAGGSVSYSSPWQLIWVFDEDPATEVVCEGYSKAFQYLCDRSDFDGNVKCWSVTGTMDDVAHMWNLVRMPNDRVYLADITNSDSGTIGASGQLFMVGCYSGDPDSGYVFRSSLGDDAYWDCRYVYDGFSKALFSRAQLSVSPAEYLNDDQTAVDDGEFDVSHWQYTANGISCTITGYSGPGGEVIIPREIDGCPVTAIAAQAFAHNEEITSITMRDGIVSIGTEAFYQCTNLMSVMIPGSVMQMGEYIFQRCRSLSHVILGEGLTEIGAAAFCDCTSLASIQIPSTVKTIGGSAFFRCTSLTELYIPANATLIEPTYFGYFYGCTALRSVSVAADNPVYQSIDGVIFSKDGATLLSCPPGKAGAYTVPNGVTRVDGYAFYGCADLTAIDIPEGTLTIGPDAFTECSSLQRITIPSTIRAIGIDEHVGLYISWGNPFTACNSLQEINVASGNGRFSSADGVLFCTDPYSEGTQQMELAVYPPAKSAASYAVPEGVNRIGSGAFYEAANLRSITFPNSVTEMMYNAFRGCTGLESITLPSGLTTLANSVFYDCTNLQYVTIPDSVTSIGDHVFHNCTSLQGIYCSIDSYAASWALTNGYTILSDSSVTDGDWQALVNGDTCTITKYTGTAANLVIPETVGGYTVTGVAAKVFQNNTNLVTVSIPDAVSSIGAYAFANCTSLISIDLPDSLTAISESMLNNCSNLDSLTIPESVTRIEGWSLQFCTSLTSIVVPASVTEISHCAFHSCFALTDVSLSQNVATLGNDVFSDCYQLKSLIIPDSVVEIGINAFHGCELLTIYCTSSSYASQWAELNSFSSVVLIDSLWSEPVYEWAADYSAVTAIRRHATDDSLTQTEIAYTRASVGKSPSENTMGETIYTAVFENTAFDSQIISVENIPALGDMKLLQLPSSLLSIGDEAFMYSSCQGVIIPESCQSIGSKAFAGCAELIYVKVSKDTVLADDAFKDCGCVLIDYIDEGIF